MRSVVASCSRRRATSARRREASSSGAESGVVTAIVRQCGIGSKSYSMNLHQQLSPSPWVQRFAGQIVTGGRVLDLACGQGRHSRYLAGLGYQVEALDRDAAALASLAGVPGITTCEADVEGG